MPSAVSSRIRLGLFLALTLLAKSTVAQEIQPPQNSGIKIEGAYTLDFFSNLNGGVDEGSEVLGLVKLAASLDLEKLMQWSGTRAHFHGLGIHGGSISDRVGDLQAVSNIEAPSALRIYEAWLEQDFGDGNGSFLFGLYDVNSEFDVIPSAGLFLNSSQGIGSEFGLSGRNGPSIFPFSSLGARLKFEPSESWYAQFGIFDGVPGDPHTHTGTHIGLHQGDGFLMTAELGLMNSSFDKLALGVWTFTNDLAHWTQTSGSGDPIQQKASPGIYLLLEKSFTQADGTTQRGLNFYTRTGIADGSVQPVDLYLGGGLVYTGPIPTRPDDQVGCAIGAGHLSDEFQSAASGGGNWDAWETALELTYSFQLNRWLSLQPDLQYIINPSGDPTLENATVIGLRLIATF